MVGRHAGRPPDLSRSGREPSCAEAKVEKWAGTHREAMMEEATRLLRNRDAAEDVVQRACVKAFSRARSKPATVGAVRNPRAWMVGITRKRALDVLRTEKRRSGLGPTDRGARDVLVVEMAPATRVPDAERHGLRLPGPGERQE